jgi:hypothetical protein
LIGNGVNAMATVAPDLCARRSMVAKIKGDGLLMVVADWASG